jgi:hypothetical protein
VAVVDGFSELSGVDLDAVRPDAGAKDTRFLVVTSRVPTHLPEAVVIRPLEFGLRDLDRLLDAFVAESADLGDISGEEREELRERVKQLMFHIGRDQDQPRTLPMIFLKLMIDRAEQLRDSGVELRELPGSVIDLVEGYTCAVLKDRGAWIDAARSAALVCLGRELRPMWRPEGEYKAVGLTSDDLTALSRSGLLVESGSKGDPHFKFSLDPIAEYLAAWEWVIGIRDGRRTREDLARVVAVQPPPDGFLHALEMWARKDRVDLGLPDSVTRPA